MNKFYVKHEEFAGKTYDELHIMLDAEINKELHESGSGDKDLARRIMEEMSVRT